MNVSLIFWTLHLAVLPVYVWGSGSMQPSHMILLMALATSSLQRKKSAAPGGLEASVMAILREKGRLVCFVFSLFALYVCMVNSVWSMLLNSYKPLLFASFQVYNLLLSYFIYRMVISDFRGFLKHTMLGFSAALILIVVALLVTGIGTASRESGLFNNPNQLAFFCLSTCVVFFALEKLHVGSTAWNRTAIGLACFVCMLTVSRAGLACCALVFMASIVDSARRASTWLLMLVVGGALLASIQSLDLIGEVQTRNERTQAVFDNQIEGRGYDRIIRHPEYLLLGAGEGENRRHGGDLAALGGELHSSVGTLLFSYGVVGLLIYGSLWLLMYRAGAGLSFKMCALAPIAYSVTHNGLRFTAGVIAIMLLIYVGTALRMPGPSPKIFSK